jgi:hypothetical protein
MKLLETAVRTAKRGDLRLLWAHTGATLLVKIAKMPWTVFLRAPLNFLPRNMFVSKG